MAAFPSYVIVKLDGFSQADSAVVERSDMEKGVAKVRRIQSDPVVTASCTLYFRSAADVERFRQWFYSRTGAAAGAAWFDWVDPRTRATRQCRMVPSSMGPLTPLRGRFARASQTAAFEYVERFE